MKVTVLGKERPVWVAALGILLLVAVGYAQFMLMLYREFLLLCALAMVWMLARGDLKRLWNLPSVLLLSYVGYTAISVFWAISGKFFLNQFCKLFPAATIFVALALFARAERGLARSVMAAVSGVSATIALLGVEAASTGLFHWFAFDLCNVAGIQMTFNTARLYGVFGNSNVEASVYAIGVFFALALALDTEDRRRRIIYDVLLALNAFAFVLAFSMGAIICFAVAAIVYLLAAGKGRGAALSLMLFAAIPTVLFAFAASRFFNSAGALKLLPLVLMALDAATVAALDRVLTEKLGAVFMARGKLLLAVFSAIAALLVLFIVFATRLSAPYTFDNDQLYRSVRLAPGEHSLTVEADGDITAYIISKNRLQVLTDGKDVLYSGDAATAAFTVPADSLETRLTFAAGKGVTIRSASVDGKTPIMLRYRLLPNFIANRLQGTLTTSSSTQVRVMLWRDGLRFWKLSPVIGKGLGSFETGITRVQDFDYETKFVHNHYIQVLLEGGVIGFGLFLAAQIALGAALWKRRKALREGPYAILYPAFAAEFVMNILQMIWDIEMTNVFFLSQTYAFYAVLVLLCAEPLGKRAADNADAPPETADSEITAGNKPAANARKKKPKGGKKAPLKPAYSTELRAACMIIPVFLSVTVFCNIVSHAFVTKTPDTLDQYLKNLETAAKIDLYEHADAELNYALQVAQYNDTEQYLPRANACAEKLSKMESNSVHTFLAEYYLNTQQYEKAIDMALLATIYAASDNDTWNSNVSLLQQTFLGFGLASPLMEQADTLLPKLMAYYNALQARNAAAPVPIKLTLEHEAFFDAVLALDACGGDKVQMAQILSASGVAQ